MSLGPSIWPKVERRLSEEFGTTIRLLDDLGRPRGNRATWAADAEGVGEVIIKARFRDRAGAKTTWCARNLRLLADRGYPVPQYVWFGLLDRDRYLIAQRRLPGHPVQVPDEDMLRELISLVELQAGAGIEPGSRDMAGYHALVLFEGWDHFWRDARAASAEAQGVCARLTRLLRPFWGYRLAATDFAHGDLNTSNVLVEGSTITGVVDWDEFGLNSRAADLASILFDWHRVYLHHATGAGERGANELLRRIVLIAGEPGLRCNGVLRRGDPPRNGASSWKSGRARSVGQGGGPNPRFDRGRVGGHSRFTRVADLAGAGARRTSKRSNPPAWRSRSDLARRTLVSQDHRAQPPRSLPGPEVE